MSKNSKPSPKSTEWTKADVSRVTSAVATKTGGQITKGSWISKVQSTVDKRTK